MPQPIRSLVSDAHVYLDPSVLSDKPDMAIMVSEIFAHWADIEIELGFLLIRIIGADAAPAIAMYAQLRTRTLQATVLNAAAEAVLDPDHYDIFCAVTATAEAAQKSRNQLAHWNWGGCRQRPDLLILADPKMIQAKDLRVAKYFSALPKEARFDTAVYEAAWDLYQFDLEGVIAYSKSDLERSLRDLREVSNIIQLYKIYNDPGFKSSLVRSMVTSHPDQIKSEVHERLMERRLFSEALANVKRRRAAK